MGSVATSDRYPAVAAVIAFTPPGALFAGASDTGKTLSTLVLLDAQLPNAKRADRVSA